MLPFVVYVLPLVPVVAYVTLRSICYPWWFMLPLVAYVTVGGVCYPWWLVFPSAAYVTLVAYVTGRRQDVSTNRWPWVSTPWRLQHETT